MIGRTREWGLAGLQLVSWGSFFYAFAALNEPIEADLGWSRDALMGGLSVGLVTAGLFSPVVGAAIDRGRGCQLMAAGDLLGAAMLLLWATTEAQPVFYLAWVGLGLAQAMTLYDAGFAVVTRRLGAAAPPALLRMTLVGGFAGTVFIPAVSLLSAEWGWRVTLIVLAGINLFFSAPLHALILWEDGSAEAHPPPPSEAVRQTTVVRSLSFWQLVATSTAWSFIFGALTFHLLPLLQERALDAAVAVVFFAAIGPLQIAGRFGLVVCGGSEAPGPLGRLLTCGLLIAIILLAVAGAQLVILAVGIAVYGLSNGMITVLRGTSIAAYLGRDGFGRKSGLVSAVSGVALAASPYTAAAIWQVGGYDLVLAILGAVALVGAVAFWTLPRDAGSARHEALKEDVEETVSHL